jgi:hypothetical protein
MSIIQGTNNNAQRKSFVVAARLGTGTGYTPIGTKIPDATMETNQDVTTEIDIFEQAWVTVGAAAPTMSFEGVVNGIEYDLHKLMLDSFIDGDTSMVQDIDCILIFGYDGAVGNYTAARRSSCTLQFRNLGGAGEAARTNQGFTLHIGGEKTRGTANSLEPNAPVTFTPTI